MQILVKNSGRVAAKPSEVAGKASGDGLLPVQSVQSGTGAAATEEGARARHAEPAGLGAQAPSPEHSPFLGLPEEPRGAAHPLAPRDVLVQMD